MIKLNGHGYGGGGYVIVGRGHVIQS